MYGGIIVVKAENSLKTKPNQIKPYMKENLEPHYPTHVSYVSKTNEPVLCHIKSIFHIVYHMCGFSCTNFHKIADRHSKTFPTNFTQIC
jgi:hypothetical protein